MLADKLFTKVQGFATCLLVSNSFYGKLLPNGYGLTLLNDCSVLSPLKNNAILLILSVNTLCGSLLQARI